MPDVTEMLIRWNEGDEDALGQLMPVLYDELKRLARSRLQREDDGLTLDTTGLVHEAYLRLVDVRRVEWNDRGHFLAMASRAMRRILIDGARKRLALKRGGSDAHEPWSDDLLVGDEQAVELTDLGEALDRLGQAYPRQSQAVELLYFGGLTQEEVATVLQVSQPTVARDLRFARAWLASEWTAL